MRALAWASLLVLATVPVFADLARLPEPTWVAGAPWVPSQERAANGQDFQELLTDYQVNLGTQEFYYHFAFRFLTAKAVQSSSTFQIRYSPEFQAVTLHRLVLWRAGKPRSQLNLSFQDLQREKGLEESLFDGERSWVAFLKDVRPDDVLEAAYTIRGQNPTFRGRFADEFRLQGELPADEWRFRLLAPAGRSPEFRVLGAVPPPVTRRVGDSDETTVVLAPAPASPWNDRSPLDSDLSPRLIVSDWKTWSDVVTWATPLYTPGSRPELREKALELTRNRVTVADKALALLSYVQDDVRYLGIEVGPNSHEPHPPVDVLQNGFGDCKDKAVLFCALAREVGLDAWPVLVDTGKGELVHRGGPTPLAFNHVIVALSYRNAPVFLDTSASRQGGPLEKRILGDYRWGLELRPGVTSLTRLPGASAGGRTLEQTYHFSAFDAEARVAVVYRFEGSDAEWQRARLEGRSEDSWRQDEDEWLHDEYGDAKIVEGPHWTDDRANNVVEIRYEFVAESLWRLEEGVWKAAFSPSLLASLLSDPTSVAERWQPFLLEHPLTVRQVTRLNLPGTWKLEKSEETVTGPGFQVLARLNPIDEHTLEFVDEYQSLADRIPTAEWKTYLESLEKGRLAGFWTLSHVAEATAGPEAQEASEAPATPESRAKPGAAQGGLLIAGGIFFLLFSLLSGLDF